MLQNTVSLLFSFTLLLNAAVSSAASKNIPPAGSSKAASKETKLDEITKKLQALNFKKDDDQIKGQDLTVQLMSEFEKFEKLSSKDSQRTDIFKKLVAASREASIFDFENQIGEMLAHLMKKDSVLKSQYESLSKDFSRKPKLESCKSQKLENSVATSSCFLKNGVDYTKDSGSKEDDKTLSCVKAFDFETCIK